MTWSLRDLNKGTSDTDEKPLPIVDDRDPLPTYMVDLPAYMDSDEEPESLFEKYQAASRLSIKRVIATYTKVSLVVGNSS